MFHALVLAVTFNCTATLPSGATQFTISCKAPTPKPSAAPTAKPSASPSPTAPPTTAPTAAPTPVASCCASAVEWPASFAPFGASSFWNRPVSAANPALLANSDAIVANEIGGASRLPTVRTQEWGTGYDDGHPTVVARASDPLVTLQCTWICGAFKPFPQYQQIRIPAKARAGDGGDAHLTVVQPDGTEIDFGGISGETKTGDPDFADGGSMKALTVAACGSFYSGSGTLVPTYPGSGASHGDNCLAGGVVSEAEMAVSHITHALTFAPACTGQSFVYPAGTGTDNLCSGSGPHAPYGAHYWLDLSDAQIDGLPIKGWEKTLLHALHQYGGYVLDTGNGAAYGGNPVGVTFEDDGSFAPFGVTPPMHAWAAAQGWSAITISPDSSRGYSSTGVRYIGADESWNPLSSVGGWTPHLHIVDPCYAQGAC